MCTVCNTLKIQGNVDGIIALMDEMDEHRPLTRDDDKCYRGMDLYLGSIDLCEQWEACNLAVARELGEPEPVLYKYDPMGKRTYDANIDIVALVVEIQGRMDNGMHIIKECTTTRDTLRTEYYGLKARCAKGKALMVTWLKEDSSRTQKQWPHLSFLYELNQQCRTVGAKLGATNEQLSTLWDHWRVLQGRCMSIIGGDKSVWVEYFKINAKEEQEEWMYNYLNDLPQSRDDDHLKDSPVIDNRMLVSHEAYAVSHKEEQAELYVYNM